RRRVPSSRSPPLAPPRCRWWWPAAGRMTPGCARWRRGRTSRSSGGSTPRDWRAGGGGAPGCALPPAGGGGGPSRASGGRRRGAPGVAGDGGALPGIGEPAGGKVLPPGDVAAWTAALAELWGDPEGRRSSGEAALATARERFGSERAHAALMEIYGGP